MGTLSNYVEDEQTPLTADNYNEVDGAVFSQLSYFTFEECGYTSNNAQISVSDYAQEILNHPDNYKKTELTADETAFLQALANSERYQNCTMSNFHYDDSLKVDGKDLDSQWAAYTVDINDGTDTSVVAMRGTDGTTLGWKEDFELAYDADGTNAQQLSAEYLKTVDSSNIILSGHSKGGNDVIAAYMMSDSELRDRITRIDNYDGPGVNEAFKTKYEDGYAELDGKLNNFYPDNSIIGRLLIDKNGNNTFVQADVRPAFEDKGILGEHDLFSFGTDDGGSFIEAEPSALSDFLNETLDQAVSKLSPEQLENLVNTLDKFDVFSLIAGDGEDAYTQNKEAISEALDAFDKYGIIPDFIKDKMTDTASLFANAYELYQKYKSMTPEEKEALITTLSVVAETACDKIAKEVAEWYNDIKEKVKNKIADTFDYVCDKFSQFRDSVVSTFNNIKNSIISKLEEFTDIAVNYFESCRERLSDIVNSILGNGNHMFSINISSIKAEIGELQKVSKNLNKQIDRLCSVKSDLDKLRYGVNVAALALIITKLEKERKDCDELAETLAKIVDLYVKTESKICAQA